MSDRTRAEKVALIIAAANYNSEARAMASCNSLYMGSMATASLYRALGGDWPNEGLPDVLDRASDEQIDAGLECCANIIEHGKLDQKTKTKR